MTEKKTTSENAQRACLRTIPRFGHKQINHPRPNAYAYAECSKAHVTQAPHLSSHAEPTRFGPDDPRPETNKHTDGIAHGKFLARTERSHDAQVDALKRRGVRHARATRTERKEHRRRRDRWREHVR